ncbi:DUF5343 domain-containing protein [Saccharopolyspora sp. K220]|uniref:DUF5343 domain-containing protein n=1 Tax=Saccharopolyspora soli TaxID=2926618 RepID=UPI001F57BC96|nr:DUF5343 domain-containing protein [Saccharopolyspora soli]MCI2423623.1 DUF5343 domain-containing protein [Saccharopolyspora soli]
MTTNNDATTSTFVPPYNLTFGVFMSSLDRMADDEALPSVIDRSYLHWMPGTVQSNYLALFRQTGLIDSNDVPTQLLHDIVYSQDARPTVVERLVQEHYAPVFELGLNATAQQLLDLWRESFGQSGETRRKAIRFFMQAAKFAGIQVSKNWERNVDKISRQTAPSRPRRSRAPRVPKQASAPESTSRPTEIVTLAEGAGKLSLGVEIDPLKLTEEDRKFVFGIIDSIHSYREAHPGNEPDDTSRETDSNTD